MNYLFDGSFDGLLTVAFDTYAQRFDLGDVRECPMQTDLLGDRYIATSPVKAQRVKAFLARQQGEDFCIRVKTAFLSCRAARFSAIVRTIHLLRQQGSEALHLVHEAVLEFLACEKEVSREQHRFLGLLRFQELADGTLYAAFEPKHHVLALVMPHFARRFPRERLLLVDEGRGLAGCCANGRVWLQPLGKDAPVFSAQECACQELWRTFFAALVIRERFNPRLQRQHMPKYTWKNLPEMQPRM